MARKVEETVSCDLPGCRKTPGTAQNDQIALTVAHDYPRAAADDVPGIAGIALDFCSWQHAAEYLTKVMGPRRDEELKQRGRPAEAGDE